MRLSPKSRAVIQLSLIYCLVLILDKLAIAAGILGLFVLGSDIYLLLQGEELSRFQIDIPPLCALFIICIVIIRKTKLRW